VGAEMRKLLAAPDPAPAVAAMARTGVLGAVLPGTDARWLAVLVHLEGDMAPRWQRRLAVLGGGDATEALRLSREESSYLSHVRAAFSGNLTLSATAFLCGEEAATDACLVKAALTESQLPYGWQAEIVRGAAAKFPVSAADLMPALEGAALGKRLDALKARWLQSDLHLTRAELLR
jgi:poly(A) polymerase